MFFENFRKFQEVSTRKVTNWGTYMLLHKKHTNIPTYFDTYIILIVLYVGYYVYNVNT